MQKLPVPEPTLGDLVYRLLKSSDDMRIDLSDYTRRNFDSGYPGENYAELMKIWRRHIDLDEEARNDQELSNALSGRPLKASPAGKGDAKGRSGCFICGGEHFARDCPERKADGGKGQRDRPMGDSRGRGGYRDQNSGSERGASNRANTPPRNKSDTPCYQWNLNCCPRSRKDCKFAHRKVLPEELAGFEKYKREYEAAKAQSKANAEGAASPAATPGADT